MLKEDIQNLEEELRLAMLSSDVEKLDKLIADSLIFTAPNGIVINKQFDLDAHRSGVQKIFKLEPSNQIIQIHDDFAIVMVNMDLVGMFNNQDFSGIFAYTRVWANSDNGFKVVAGHVSQIPA